MTAAQLELSGLIPPMITPLTYDGEIDSDGVYKLVHHLIDGGVSGIFVLGSSGEGPWLSGQQRRQLVQETVSASGGKVPVLVGVLEPSTARTLEAIALIDDTGADALVIASPYYFPADAAVQIHHITSIAKSARVPVVVYNIPPTTHNPLVARTIQQILTYDNVIAVKDSAGDNENFAALIALKKERSNFKVLQGAEKLAVDAMMAGADGLVCGLANIAPQLFVQIMTCVKNGNIAEAQQAQQQVNRLWELHSNGFWLACLKYAACLLGFGSGAMSSPAYALTDQSKQAIRNIVESQQLHS